MDLVLRSPEILGTFSKLGFKHADGYHINKNCNDGLETILHSILVEDKALRPFRRSIGFGQNIQKDMIPILISSKEDKTIELIIKILVNLTVPIECLLSLDVVAKTDFGRHAIFEINNLLVSTKQTFTDHRVTKVVIEYLKKNADVEQSSKLSPEQCVNISNCLLLLRNVLHIPEEAGHTSSTDATLHAVQNQILWNIFSQSFDKILIKLMTIPEAENWCVSMVQLIALVYKDQHVVNLHKLLNLWMETSLSESSEDNESNTSPPNRGSDDSSPIMTSEPTSDSSDTGGSGKCSEDVKPDSDQWRAPSPEDAPPPQTDAKDHSTEKPANKELENVTATTTSSEDTDTTAKKKQNTNVTETMVTSEPSDCGYDTQKETQESISTSSNEEEQLAQKQAHQKPTNPKLRPNNKSRVSTPLEKKKKKIVKRAKANIINVQGLTHITPTDDDISHVLKEFTVDFLLKGYNSLVQTLHTQILSDRHLEIDTSHFFWLVTYFLKFATQLELDLELVSSVLSFEIVSYLTAEAVNLCEQFELAVKLGGCDNKAITRRLHLIVTAIREFILAVEVYKRQAQMSQEDEAVLEALQEKMCETEELRSLFVLLLRHYNPKYQNKQYLQDLIVTNHNLLLFLEAIMKSPKLKSSACIQDHIKQFSTAEMMHQYGLMLEDFTSNGEFVNDCVFTLMHHVGGELNNVIALYQPNILRTFTNICDAEFEICDDWSDLVKFVINTFMKKPQEFVMPECFLLDGDTLLGGRQHRRQGKRNACKDSADDKKISAKNDHPEDKWSDDELTSLNWHFLQCKTSVDMIGDIITLFKEEGVTKSRESLIRVLYKQKFIKKHEYEKLCFNDERPKSSSRDQQSKQCDEIRKLCDQLIQDGRGKFLDWIQTLLLETCFAKIYNEKCRKLKESNRHEKDNPEVMNFELFKKKDEDSNFPLVSPVADHYLLLNESVPVVPWNSEQAAICKDLKFLQLLHKLGFQMPVDTGKVFLRIPCIWAAEYLYDLAGKIKPIETGKLKFSVNSLLTADKPSVFCGPAKWHGSAPPHGAPDNSYQIQKQNHLAYMLNYTPMPMSSFSSENMAAIPYDEAKHQNWMDIIRRSQENKLPTNLKCGLMNECHEGISELPPCGASPFLPEVPGRVCVMDPFNQEVPGCGPERFIPDPPGCGSDRFIPDPAGCGPDRFIPDMCCDSAMDIQPVDNCYDDHKAADIVASIPLYESDDNNSICETASMASNLTRMYVSDEDEKSPDTLPPHPLLLEQLGLKLDGITELRFPDTLPPF